MNKKPHQRSQWRHLFLWDAQGSWPQYDDEEDSDRPTIPYSSWYRVHLAVVASTNGAFHQSPGRRRMVAGIAERHRCILLRAL